MNNDDILGLELVEYQDNIHITSPDTNDKITFFKTIDEVQNESLYKRFVKNIEYLIRTDKRYKAYIGYLINDLNPKLNHCMLYSEIKVDIATVEIHHGPILTLYDCVDIILNFHLKKQKLITSIRIANTVMQEHLNNNIQIAMLSQMAHKAMHPTKMGIEPKFLDYRHCHGDIVTFIQKYYEGLSLRHVAKIQRYIEKFQKETQNSSPFFEEIVSIWTKEVFER